MEAVKCQRHRESAECRKEHERGTVLPARGGQEAKLPVFNTQLQLHDYGHRHYIITTITTCQSNIKVDLRYHHHHVNDLDLHDADPRSRWTRLGRSGRLDANDWTRRASNVNPPSWEEIFESVIFFKPTWRVVTVGRQRRTGKARIALRGFSNKRIWFW